MQSQNKLTEEYNSDPCNSEEFVRLERKPMLRKMRLFAAFQALMFIEDRIKLQNEDLEGHNLDSSAYQSWKEGFLKHQEQFAQAKLVNEELARGDVNEQETLAESMYEMLNDEQAALHDAVCANVKAADEGKAGASAIFVDAPAG